jgi:hypothetical protein
MENEEPLSNPLDLVCYWCNKPIPSSIQLKTAICPNCYKLMLGAGISDAEIFQENSPLSEIE